MFYFTIRCGLSIGIVPAHSDKNGRYKAVIVAESFSFVKIVWQQRGNRAAQRNRCRG
jgi:hypothetical protein